LAVEPGWTTNVRLRLVGPHSGISCEGR